MREQTDPNDFEGSGTSLFESTTQSQRLTANDNALQQSAYASALSRANLEDDESEQRAFESFRQNAEDSEVDSQMQSFERASTVIQCLAVSTNTAENVALLRKQQQSLQSFIEAVAQIKRILNEKSSLLDFEAEAKAVGEKSQGNPQRMTSTATTLTTTEAQRKTDCDSTLKCNASNSTASCNVSKFTS